MRRSLRRSRSLPVAAVARRGVSPRPPRLLPVGQRSRRRHDGGEPCAHRVVPRLDGGPRARGVDDRPSALDSLWLLPIRTHRRAHPGQPRPIRPPTPGPRIGHSWAGSLRNSACSCSLPRAAWIERPACQRSLCHQHRRPRLRARPSHAADRGQGNKPATVPLVPRTARTIDLAIGECHDGPILRRRDGQRLDRRTEHLRDQPPDGPPVGHGSTLASCMSGRTSTPQYVAAGLRAAISKARSRLSQSTIVKLPRYSLASA